MRRNKNTNKHLKKKTKKACQIGSFHQAFPLTKPVFKPMSYGKIKTELFNVAKNLQSFNRHILKCLLVRFLYDIALLRKRNRAVWIVIG